MTPSERQPEGNEGMEAGMRDENAILSRAVVALGDDLAEQLRACEEILKTEADIGRRRSAQARYMTLTNPRKDVAA